MKSKTNELNAMLQKILGTPRIINKIFVCYLGITLTGFSAFAQRDCAQNLIDAEKYYYNGRFSHVEQILEPCISDGFTKEQKIEAFRLIALSNIYTRDFEGADSALHEMLSLQPQYEAGPLDPPELSTRIDKFGVRPKAALSVHFGSYLPFFRIDEVYNLRNISSEVAYKGSTGIQFGLSFSYFLSKKIVLDGSLERQAFNFTVTDKNEINETRLYEEQRRNQVSVSTGYNQKIMGVDFRFSAGVGFNKLVKATSDLYKLEEETGSNYAPDPPTSSPTYSIIYREDLNFSNMEHRTTADFRPFLMMKSMLPLKNNFMLNLFARYEFGTQNMTRNRGSNTEQMLKFEWVEDDFKAHYLSIGIEFTKLFYNVR